MIQIPKQLVGLKDQTVLRWCSLWRITRTDGVVHRFTDHDSVISYAGNDYTPAVGVNPSARQKQSQMQPRNAEFKAIIDSVSITYDDLRAGRFRAAKVEEMIIDWRYPWADPIDICTYWVASTQFDGEMWTCQVEGFSLRLKQAVGRKVTRTCTAVFGDQYCGKDVTAQTHAMSVTGINIPRVDFNTSNSFADGTFKYGYLRWTSGSNQNQFYDIFASFNASGRVVLWTQTPLAIQIGDTFNAVEGCDHTLLGPRGCKFFDNVENFRGFPYVPGTDSMLKTPNSHVKA